MLGHLGAFFLANATQGLNSPHDSLIWNATGGDVDLYWLTKGLIARESAWDPTATRFEANIDESSVGLMQVLPSTARDILPWVTASDLLDPAINIEAGVGYLRQQVEQYGTEGGISAYNAGRPISGNVAYVQDVLAYRNFYAEQDPFTMAIFAGEPMLIPPEEPSPIPSTPFFGEVSLGALVFGIGVLGLLFVAGKG